MIFAKADGQWVGAKFPAAQEPKSHALECTILSEQPLESIELVVNGTVTQRFEPQNIQSETGSRKNQVSARFTPETSSWVAWRCFEKRPANRFRFAHTAPWYFDIEGKPLRPRRAEAEWLTAQVKEEMKRSQGIVPETLMNDYQHALQTYEKIAKAAQ
jgi:hypothetical protein